MAAKAQPQDWVPNAKLRARVEKYISPEPMSGCWLWTGATVNDGYGIVRVGDRICKAHRVVYALERGPIPAHLDIDHLCRNRSCVNPAHLEPVTPAVNNYRGMGLGGANRRKTHCKRGHPLSGDNVRTYATAAEGGVRRVCRTCCRDRGRAPVVGRWPVVA